LRAAAKGCRFHRGWVAGLYLHLKIASADSVAAVQILLTRCSAKSPDFAHYLCAINPIPDAVQSLLTLRFPLLRKTFLLFADAWRVPAILKKGRPLLLRPNLSATSQRSSKNS